MTAFLCMQDRMIAGLITALILSSFSLSMGIDKTAQHQNQFIQTIQCDGYIAEIKVHRPGDLINSTETLSWSPNNLSDYHNYSVHSHIP